MSNQSNTQWTKEKTEELILRWRRGESQTYIGKVFGMSRSAIAGKIDRLGIVRPNLISMTKSIISLPKLSDE